MAPHGLEDILIFDLYPGGRAGFRFNEVMGHGLECSLNEK